MSHPASQPMPAADRERWDARYRSGIPVQHACATLTENLHLLPDGGHALDLACGLGANARVLAAAGLTTEGWDVSPVAIERLAALAAAEGLRVRGCVRDALAAPPEPASFDVIVVAHFFERTLLPALAAALRPGGLLFYETFTRRSLHGPSNPDWKLDDNELPTALPGLRLRVYRDEQDAGDPALGLRGITRYVGQRPR